MCSNELCINTEWIPCTYNWILIQNDVIQYDEIQDFLYYTVLLVIQESDI
jgi:hypothetical protein